jgi:hypothetical protein
MEMKRSPLQLEWVSYPSASYEYLEDQEAAGPIAVDLRADVTWDLDGEHMAAVTIKNREDTGTPYRFNVQAAAIFKFDLDVAIEHYKPSNPLALPGIIAVNVCRILFSGAREQIAMMTARGPSGPVLIEGVVLEPSDLSISSTVEPPRILLEVFKVPTDVVKEIEQRAKELQNEAKSKKKTPKQKQTS